MWTQISLAVTYAYIGNSHTYKYPMAKISKHVIAGDMCTEMFVAVIPVSWSLRYVTALPFLVHLRQWIAP